MKKNAFEYILNDLIPTLQEYEPAKNTWEQISSNLDFDIELKTSVPKLSAYLPDKNLWSRIDKQLDQEMLQKTNIVKLLRAPVSIAATVLLILSLYIAFNYSKSIEIIYTEEVSVEWHNMNESVDFGSSINPELFILEACSKHSFMCETEEFKENWALLCELNQNLQKINSEIDRYGTSVSLEKSKIKLENLKSQVVKEMIKHIVS